MQLTCWDYSRSRHAQTWPAAGRPSGARLLWLQLQREVSVRWRLQSAPVAFQKEEEEGEKDKKAPM
jgi:hypothetical protein